MFSVVRDYSACYFSISGEFSTEIWVEKKSTSTERFFSWDVWRGRNKLVTSFAFSQGHLNVVVNAQLANLEEDLRTSAPSRSGLQSSQLATPPDTGESPILFPKPANLHATNKRVLAFILRLCRRDISKCNMPCLNSTHATSHWPKAHSSFVNVWPLWSPSTHCRLGGLSIASHYVWLSSFSGYMEDNDPSPPIAVLSTNWAVPED